MEAALTQTLEHAIAAKPAASPTPRRPALALVVAFAFGIAAATSFPSTPARMPSQVSSSQSSRPASPTSLSQTHWCCSPSASLA